MISITVGDMLDEMIKKENYYSECGYRKRDRDALCDQECYMGKVTERYEEEFVNKKGETKTRTKFRDIPCPRCKGKGELPNHNMSKLRALKELLDSIPLEEPNAV